MRTIGRVRDITGVVLGAAAGVIGAILSTLFVVLMLAGGVYKTECTLPNGVHTEGWALGESFPYLWDPGERCEATTLTRIALGEMGFMSEVK